MFQTESEFHAYILETREWTPVAPAIWEEVSFRVNGEGPVLKSYCRSWMRALSDVPLIVAHAESVDAFSNAVIADCRRRSKEGKVLVKLSTRDEATHIGLEDGSVIWLGRVIRAHRRKEGLDIEQIHTEEQRVRDRAAEFMFQRIEVSPT